MNPSEKVHEFNIPYGIKKRIPSLPAQHMCLHEKAMIFRI